MGWVEDDSIPRQNYLSKRINSHFGHSLHATAKAIKKPNKHRLTPY